MKDLITHQSTSKKNIPENKLYFAIQMFKSTEKQLGFPWAARTTPNRKKQVFHLDL